MNITTEVEKASNIVRKLKVTVPKSAFNQRFEKRIAEVQRTAKLKGFRPGHVPIQLVREYYGVEVTHQVFQKLIDDSYREALQKHELKPIGQPKIESLSSPAQLTLAADDLTYTATVEVLPEIQVKGYTGISLTQMDVKITDQDVESVVKGLQDQHAELLSRTENHPDTPIQKGDFVDFEFEGKVVTDEGLKEHQGLKGQRLVEIGSEALIPGFENHLIGMKKTETKTFKIAFPTEFEDKALSGKEGEFTVTVHEIKEKKLPEVDNEFAKEAGYESKEDLYTKVREAITRSRAEESQTKLRNDVIRAVIEKNPFDVPDALIQAQVRSLMQETFEDLKQRGYNEQIIQQIIGGEFENLKKRAEEQVRAGLLLDAVAKTEKLEVKPETLNAEIEKMAASTKMEISKIREFYDKNPDRKENLRFRILEDHAVQFLLSKAKIKS